MKDTNIRDFLSRPIIELIPPLFLNNNENKITKKIHVHEYFKNCLTKSLLVKR